jgi:hypothetical protein
LFNKYELIGYLVAVPAIINEGTSKKHRPRLLDIHKTYNLWTRLSRAEIRSWEGYQRDITLSKMKSQPFRFTTPGMKPQAFSINDIFIPGTVIAV